MNRMPKSLLFAVLCVLAFNLKAQIATNTVDTNQQNIYNLALTKYIAASADSTKQNIISDTIYIQGHPSIVDKLCYQIGKTRIVVVGSPYQFIRQHRSHSITLCSIFPLQLEDGKFSVTIIPYEAWILRKRKRTVAYSYSCSTTVFFNFSNNAFEYLSTYTSCI